MKQSILFFLIGYSFISLLNYEKKKENDLKKEGLRGKVKSIIESVGEPYRQVYSRNVYKYNENGYLIEKSNGEENDLEIIKYDTLDRKVLEIKSVFHKETGHIFRFEYKNRTDTFIYDSSNNCIKRYLKSDGDELIYIFKYDSLNNLIEERCLSNKRLNHLFLYKYDNSKNLIEYIHEDVYNPKYRIIYKYDVKGNKIEENQFRPDGNHKYAYKYDKRHNVIFIEEIKPWGSYVKTLNKYDRKNNLIKIETYYSNPKDKVAGVKLAGITYFKYSYDKKGNWIKKIITRNYGVEIKIIIERIIEYY